MHKPSLLTLYTFFRLTVSATVQLTNNTGLQSSQSLSPSNLTLGGNTTTTGPFRIDCFKADKRGSAKPKPCDNAAQHLPSSRQRTDFINRRYGAAEDAVPLPMNFVSGKSSMTFLCDTTLIKPMLDDANCIITVSLRESEREGRTDYYILRESAYAVLHSCVQEQEIGGIATDFSKPRHVVLHLPV